MFKVFVSSVVFAGAIGSAHAQDEAWRDLVSEKSTTSSDSSPQINRSAPIRVTKNYDQDRDVSSTRSSEMVQSANRSRTTFSQSSTVTTSPTNRSQTRVSNQPYQPPQPYRSRTQTSPSKKDHASQLPPSSNSTVTRGTSPNRPYVSRQVTSSTTTHSSGESVSSSDTSSTRQSRSVVSGEPYRPPQPYRERGIPNTSTVIRSGSEQRPAAQLTRSTETYTAQTPTPVGKPVEDVATQTKRVTVRPSNTETPSVQTAALKPTKQVEPDSLNESKQTLPSREVIYDILWSTLEIIELSKSQNNFNYLWQITSPEFKRNLTPKELHAMFLMPEVRSVALGTAIGVPPEFELSPHIRPDGRMRLRGMFDIPPKDLQFDLLYVLQDQRWVLDAMAFAHPEK